MHTSIDVNSNDLNNVRNMTGVNTMRVTGEAGAINMSNGINACEDNTWGCGLSVSDDGGIYDLNDKWLTVMMAYGPEFGLHVQGNVKVDRNIGAHGYDPNAGLPTGWGGGVHTWDVYSEATIAAGHNGAVNATVGGAVGAWSEGAIIGSTFAQGQVLRPTLTVEEDQVCSSTPARSIISESPTNAGNFDVVNGDIAKDIHGATMSCVDGRWHATTNTFAKFVRSHQCGVWGGENGTSKTHLMELEFQARRKGAYGVVWVNGVEAAYVDYSQPKGFLGVGKGGSVTHTVTFSLPPYSRWTTRTGHVNNICVTEME